VSAGRYPAIREIAQPGHPGDQGLGVEGRAVHERQLSRRGQVSLSCRQYKSRYCHDRPAVDDTIIDQS